MNWAVVAERLKLDRLRLEDVNDILILADQFPVSDGFFKTFLSEGSTEITFDQLKSGITRFKGFAVLLFGNIRFAYRKLRHLDTKSLLKELQGLDRSTATVVEEDFHPRREPLLLPAAINQHLTWLLGYIAKNKADRDITMFAAMAVLLGKEDEKSFLRDKNETESKLYVQLKTRLQSTSEWRRLYPDFSVLKEQITKLQDDINESRRRGWLNTSHYLALDHMDVYVATSMRERWEFEDVHKTANGIFSQPGLTNLKLRYFDPTQSFLENRVDKGLVEALMLKRSRCTIYMAQETDTFGKDSELATTLAQGKPVIVFVPEIDLNEYARAAAKRPLGYLQRRLPQLLAEDRIPMKFVIDVLKFLTKVSTFDPYFYLVGEEEPRFLSENKGHEEKQAMCQILATAEKSLFNSRARSLQKSHPLAIQVRLESGVANGVLVVRSIEECALLLEHLLTNACSFTFDDDRERGILCLVEKISDSPFRVVTENATVSNAFWSRYLTEHRRTRIPQ